MRSSAEIDEFVRAFGRRVKSVREQKELTQLDLAIAAEMDVRQIQRIENGQINTSIDSPSLRQKQHIYCYNPK